MKIHIVPNLSFKEMKEARDLGISYEEMANLKYYDNPEKYDLNVNHTENEKINYYNLKIYEDKRFKYFK